MFIYKKNKLNHYKLKNLLFQKRNFIDPSELKLMNRFSFGYFVNKLFV
jgi:hypothetical protein